MKDPADEGRTGELLVSERLMRRFVERGQAAQRAVDELGAGAWTCCLCGFRGFWSGGPHCYTGDAPRPKPKRGVSKNAAKSAGKPERGER